MTISQLKKLESDITSYSLEVKKLHSEIKSLNDKINKSQKQKLETEYNLFLEYIPLDYTIELTRSVGFTGSAFFKTGEIIKVFKKNEKSIVIKRVKKFQVVVPQVSTLVDCDEKYRIKISDIYYFLIRDDNFKKQFHSYLTRKESLENLGV